jgi:hypothetical protein
VVRRDLPRNEFGVPIVVSPTGVVFEAYYDPTTKQVYFMNPTTRVTQWEDPRDPAPRPWWKFGGGGAEKKAA